MDLTIKMTHSEGRFAASAALATRIPSESRSGPRITPPITYWSLSHYLHSRIIFRFIIYHFNTSSQHKKYTVHDRPPLISKYSNINTYLNNVIKVMYHANRFDYFLHLKHIFSINFNAHLHKNCAIHSCTKRHFSKLTLPVHVSLKTECGMWLLQH